MTDSDPIYPTPAAVYDALSIRIAEYDTLRLCDMLAHLATKDRRNEEEATLHTVIIDVLCVRHPEADAALDRWADSGNSDRNAMYAGIIVAALGAARAARTS